MSETNETLVNEIVDVSEPMSEPAPEKGQLLLYLVLNRPNGSTDPDSGAQDRPVEDGLLTVPVDVTEEQLALVPGWIERLAALGVVVQHGNTQTYRRLLPVLK